MITCTPIRPIINFCNNFATRNNVSFKGLNQPEQDEFCKTSYTNDCNSSSKNINLYLDDEELEDEEMTEQVRNDKALKALLGDYKEIEYKNVREETEEADDRGPGYIAQTYYDENGKVRKKEASYDDGTAALAIYSKEGNVLFQAYAEKYNPEDDFYCTQILFVPNTRTVYRENHFRLDKDYNQIND